MVRDEQRTDDEKQQMVSEWAGEGALVLRKHAVYATIQCCEKRPKASSDMDTHTHRTVKQVNINTKYKTACNTGR